MSDADENSTAAAQAAGPVRLFPLPNLVMFPHVVQPLHIFESRYCDMLEDALAGDRLIALVLLEKGWERDYEGRPAIAPVACLGKVVAHERLPTGRHNILLRGHSRVAIRREMPPCRTFRQAEVDLLDDFYPASGAARRVRARRQLVELALKLLPNSPELYEQLDETRISDMALGMLTDVFAFTLGFPAPIKQRLLAEWDVDRRAALLIEKLAAQLHRAEPMSAADQSGLPVRFGLN